MIRVGDDDDSFRKGKIQIRWEDDGTESSGPNDYGDWNRDKAINVRELDKPIGEDPGEDPMVSIGREAFVATCRAQQPNRYSNKWPVERWFEALQLELEEPGPSCVGSAAASWPLRILCVVVATILLSHFWWRDEPGPGLHPGQVQLRRL